MADLRIKHFPVLPSILAFVEDVSPLTSSDHGPIPYWLAADTKTTYSVPGANESTVKERTSPDTWKILPGPPGTRKATVTGNSMLIYVSSLLVMNWEKENER